MTDTNLTDAIFTNTTCNYLNAFNHNLDTVYAFNEHKDEYYPLTHRSSIILKLIPNSIRWLLNIDKDLQDITKLYELANNEQRGKLLQIASNFALLPFLYEKDKKPYPKLHISAYYSCCVLRRFKQEVKKSNQNKENLIDLSGSLLNSKLVTLKQLCWQNNNNDTRAIIINNKSHNKFQEYVITLLKGLQMYKCWYHSGAPYYPICDHTDIIKDINMIKNITGLKKAYPNIKAEALQQEACNIAQALSQSPKLEKWALLEYYLFYQNRLIKLQELVQNEKAKKAIYYDYRLISRYNV